MKSIIGREGGKSKLKDYIIPLIPPHKIYVEPFVGGGSIFFGKEPSENEVVNDLDKDVSNIYKDMKAVGEQMVGKDFTPTREKFDRLKSQKTFSNNAERLYRNLFLSLNSFRANRKDYVGEKEEQRKRGSEIGKTYKTTKYKDRLQGVTISNKDWKKLIKQYDSKDAFFYLDPPYSMSPEVGYYSSNEVSIDELYNTLKNIRGKFLLSYDYNNEIKNKFRGYRIRTVTTKYETNKDPITKKEYLISNF
jgi:DNA adenine methylase